MELRRNTYHFFRLMCHFVWIPKYRHKVFEEPYRSTLKSIIGRASYGYDIELVEFEIPEGHIQMVVRAEPKVAPSKVMQVIKSISAREFFCLHPDIKRRYFWGGNLWTQSYFVETRGNANQEVNRQYVQDQIKVMDISGKRSK